jgi:hypothetical protein
MSWSRALDLFINNGQTLDYVLLRSLVDMGAADRPLLVGGDRFLFRLWFIEPSISGGAPTIVALSQDAQIVVAGRISLAGAVILFAATGFAAVNSLGGLHYEAEVNLNTDEITAALGNDIAMLCAVEVQVQSPDNTERRTKQFTARLNRSGFAGLLSPTPSTPEYPTPDVLLTNGMDTANIKRGFAEPAVGDSGVAFVFSTVFATAPRTVNVWTSHKAGKDQILCELVHETIMPAGFSVVLGAQIPVGTVAGDYRVHYLAIL